MRRGRRGRRDEEREEGRRDEEEGRKDEEKGRRDEEKGRRDEEEGSRKEENSWTVGYYNYTTLIGQFLADEYPPGDAHKHTYCTYSIRNTLTPSHAQSALSGSTCTYIVEW